MAKPRPAVAPVEAAPGSAGLAAAGSLQLNDAAKFLGVSRSYLKRLVRRKELPSYLEGVRRMVPIAALVRRIEDKLAEART